MLRLHDQLVSGNAYKVRLLLALLGRSYERIEYDTYKGETRTPEFLARNPNGKIPALELEDGSVLPESNAILCYLADGTDWLPGDRLARARVLSWLFYEQYSHEPYIAVLRSWTQHPPEPPRPETEWAERRAKGEAALALMDKHLATRDWFVGDGPSIADIALYAYTHVADEGGFEMAPFPSVQDWLARVAALPGYVPIGFTPA